LKKVQQKPHKFVPKKNLKPEYPNGIIVVDIGKEVRCTCGRLFYKGGFERGAIEIKCTKCKGTFKIRKI